MDASSSAEDCKRKKVFDGKNCNEDKDRITHLPENIHQYILSFLPVKYAVRTSVLSTRWKNLWTLIHNLDFDDGLRYCSKKETLRKMKAFSNFLDKVLFANDVSNVQRFSLTCKASNHDFSKWMPTVMKRKVQEIIINISVTEKPISYFPSSLFTWDSLRILKIHMDISVKSSTPISHSWLKVLHFENVSFSGNQSMHKFSISCPALEELGLRYCKWLEIKTVDINVPKLQRLTIKDWTHGDLCDCKIKINGESIVSLKLEMGPLYEYSLCHLSSLVDAFVDLRPFYTSPDDPIAHRLGALLRGIYNVRDLEINSDGISPLSLPCFSDHMSSLSRVTNLRVVCIGAASGKQLINVLDSLPNIESLFFPRGFASFSFKGYGRIHGTTSQCFLSHLKQVDIKSFRGINSECWFIDFLIKRVRVVDKWTIKFPGDMDKWTIARLESLAKDSKCVLKFD